MSGTSADGVDAALVEISGSGLQSHVSLIAFETYPYSEEIKAQLFQAFSPSTGSVDLICQLNFSLGELFADAAIEVAKKGEVSLSEIDLIGSHGQTIHHIPGHSTLQIGESSIIAERTGVTTIADFRPRDIAAGGEGAPLAPFVHYLLFWDREKTRAVNNLGGISNVTFIPAQSDPSQVVAFDTGPGNMVIDRVVSLISNGQRSFDRNGEIASQGEINREFLNRLLTHPYFRKAPPKSTGREEFGFHYADQLFQYAREKGIEDHDLVATVTALTAESIVESYTSFLIPSSPLSEVIFCGGGAHNSTLLDMIRERLSPIAVKRVEDFNFSSDALEAMIFALLANETAYGHPSNLPGATGARSRAILGKIVPGRLNSLAIFP